MKTIRIALSIVLMSICTAALAQPKIEFEFLDVKGNMEYGHMHGAVFTIVDENQHTEDWTFMRGDKPYHAHVELRRKKER